jgi:glycosyltransferase involved in cell wall biosynthesis
MKNNALRIGLIFNYNEKWIGGTYYILNLIHVLNHIEDNKKPNLIIFSNLKDFKILKNETKYPFLEFQEFNENPQTSFLKIFNQIASKFFKFKIFKRRFKKSIDAVFPFESNNFINSINGDKRIYWIPDFQEKHFPEYYSLEHLESEKVKNGLIVENSKKLLLSSHDAKKDLVEFYPNYKTKPFVVHFAVKIPELSKLELQEVLTKFDLPELYYFAPNQFWKHKNHIVVIKAVELLLKQGIDIVVAFSGKELDPRFPGYAEELKEYVSINNLQNNVRFLGFLERQEQLKLMENAVAIIQPSLFEGWSTVIEEAMAMNKCVIASNLNVNIEQLGVSGFYFDPLSPENLAEAVRKINLSKLQIEYDYVSKQKQFAVDFLNCVNDN